MINSTATGREAYKLEILPEPKNEFGYVRPWLYDKQLEGIFNTARYSVIEASTKSGKAQPHSEIVLTDSGWMTVGAVTMADRLVGSDGHYKRLYGIHPQGLQPIYMVRFSGGSSVRVTGDHLWEVEYYGEKQILTTDEIADLPRWKFDRLNIPQVAAVQFPAQDVPIEPYAFGLLLGDGTFRGSALRFSSDDIECIEALRCAGATVDKLNGDNCDWQIRTPDPDYRYYKWNTELRNLGLWNRPSDEKFIPDCYIYNSVDVRMGVLRGLLDSDGWVDKLGQPHLEQTSPEIAASVEEIVQSLGGFVRTSIKYSEEFKDVYRQVLVVPDAREFFRLERKREKASPKKKRVVRMFKSIEFCGMEEATCFEVESVDGLYVTKDYILTHNTHACIVWLLERAIADGEANKNYWWVAPVSDQSDIAFRRMKESIPKSKYESNESRKYIKLWNGAIIWFKSADKPDSLYGEDVYAAVVDEATRCKDDSWHALRSTLTSTRGPIRIIGNVKGRANWMFKIARLAQSGDQPDMYYTKITAYDAVAAGILDMEEIENAKVIYPEAVFRELYLAEPGDDGGNPFGIQHIQRCIVQHMPDTDPVAWGWDIAKHNNWTVGIALDKDGNVCRFHRWQDTWDNTILRVPTITAGISALIDSTGTGDQLLERLRREGHTNFRGFVFSGWKAKQQIMLGLAVAIQNAEITFPEGVIVEELETFEYVVVPNSDRVLYAAPRHVHDDCVDALAMAVKLWKGQNTYAGEVFPLVLDRHPVWRIQ